jgi:hypothetical protein
MCHIIITQLANSRSMRSISFPAIFSIFQWTTGCQRQIIDVLHRCGLSLSFDGVMTAIHNLGQNCLALAQTVARQPHALCWDNVNMKTSIFVEQRPDAPSKVQSRTFAVLYQLEGVDPGLMSLAPIIDRAKMAPELEFD